MLVAIVWANFWKSASLVGPAVPDPLFSNEE